MTEDIISQQTLRMMRSSIANSAQYTDDELVACGIVIASLYPMVADVPSFIPQREQATFFANMVSCFMLGELISNGLIDPHSAKRYIDTVNEGLPGKASDFSQQAVAEEDNDDTIVVMGGKSKSTIN